MPKIVDYPETDRVAKDDVFLLDGAQGTRKALASWAAVELAGLISPVNHCNVFRGKNLGRWCKLCPEGGYEGRLLR